MHILCTLITESKRNCLACQFMRKRKNVPLESTSEHTFYLSQTPQTCLCKKKLPGVNFYRFNAKNWQFTVYFAVITQKIGNLLCILSYFTRFLGVNFILQNFVCVKKRQIKGVVWTTKTIYGIYIYCIYPF